MPGLFASIDAVNKSDKAGQSTIGVSVNYFPPPVTHPRRPHIQLHDVPLHITPRGNDREPCFFAEDDYLSHLRWPGEALA